MLHLRASAEFYSDQLVLTENREHCEKDNL